jgi:hypothetical protein
MLITSLFLLNSDFYWLLPESEAELVELACTSAGISAAPGLLLSA